jgi:tetraacyldisaccharide 4'-kinase
MYGRERSPIAEAILLTISLAYRTAIWLRRLFYSLRLFRIRKLTVPVLSVGNITLGGTGKTPTTIHIAQQFQAVGRRPVIISRGYGRTSSTKVEIVSDGKSVLLGPEQAGDEPAMMAARLDGVPVVVGRDRCMAGLHAIERFQPDMVLLDDGFQHLQLARDLNIVLVDGVDPFGNGRLFPAGILREPLSALARAQVVLITRADRAADLEGLKATIRRFTTAVIVTGAYRPIALVDVATGATRPLEVLRGAPVIAFAGIARPDALEASLTALGAEITSFRSYPDHHRYTLADLKALLEESARTASLLVATEKDGIKLKAIAPAGIWMLRIDLEIAERDAWEAALCLKP